MLGSDLHTIGVEIDIMRSIDHVQVIKLLDIFKDDANQPYLIMEKFDSSLYDFLKNRTLEEPEIIRIFTMICIPLYCIHKNGVIHRDMKPPNILVKKVGDQYVFVLTDFGISKITNGTHTTTTYKANTPPYSSEE
jgi:eukaryotic-like serine/threonine-protein kinase